MAKLRVEGQFGGAHIAGPHEGLSNIEFRNKEGKRFILNGETSEIRKLVGDFSHSEGYLEIGTKEGE